MTKPIDISTAAAALGRKGGQSTSEAKQAAARENGRRGGRPRKNQGDNMNALNVFSMQSRRCRNDQSVGDVINEMILDGVIPPESVCGDRKTNNNPPPEAVGFVEVRSREAFWIIIT